MKHIFIHTIQAICRNWFVVRQQIDSIRSNRVDVTCFSLPACSDVQPIDVRDAVFHIGPQILWNASVSASCLDDLHPGELDRVSPHDR